MYKNCANEKQKSWLTKMVKKWKRDKWKSVNIEVKRCQYRKLIILQLQKKHMHAMIVEEKYTIANNNEKAVSETQTLRAGGSKAEPKISPRRRPLPGGAGRLKFNQLETVTTY